MSSLAKRTLSSTLLGVLSFFLNIIQNIVLVPFFIRLWGVEKYGIWITIYAFILLARTIDTGHQSYIGNEFIKAFHTDLHKAKLILGSSLKVAIGLGLVEMLLFLVILSLNYEKNIIGIETTFGENIAIFSMLFMWATGGNIGGILGKIIIPMGYFNLTLIWGIVNRLLEVGIIILAVVLNWEISKTFFFLALFNMLYFIFLFKKIKMITLSLYPWWKEGTFKIGLRNYTNSFSLTINGFMEQFTNNNIINIISNQISLSTVPIFTTNRTIANTLSQVSNLMANPLTPELVRYQINKQYNKILQIVQLNNLISNIIVVLPIIVIFPYIDILYGIWVHHQLAFSETLFSLLCLGVYLNTKGKFFVLYLIGNNFLKELNILSLVRLVVVVGTASFLVPRHKLVGLGIGIFIGDFLSSFLLPAIFFYKTVGFARLKESLSSNLLDLCIFVLFTIFLFANFKSYNILFTIIITIIIILQWMFLDNDLKTYITKFIKP